MVLHKLEKINYGGKSPVSIKHQNLHSFKQGLILLCQSILETRRITHLHDSAQFNKPLGFSVENEFLGYETPLILGGCRILKWYIFWGMSFFTIPLGGPGIF